MYQLAFIVNTYNRPVDTLLACLRSILDQVSSNTQVVVVNQNIEPLEIKIPGVILVHHPHKCISVARNFGARNVEAQWYIFMDDDGVLSPGSVQELLKLINRTNAPSIIGGKIEIFDSGKAYSVRQNISEGFLSTIFLKAVMGGLLAVRRETFFSLGGFDENFGIGSVWASGEESDLVLRAHSSGSQVYFLPTFTLKHPAPGEMSDDKVFQYALGKGALLKKHVRTKIKLRILLLEFLDTFVTPVVELLISFIQRNEGRSQRARLKLKGRLKGYRTY